MNNNVLAPARIDLRGLSPSEEDRAINEAIAQHNDWIFSPGHTRQWLGPEDTSKRIRRRGFFKTPPNYIGDEAALLQAENRLTLEQSIAFAGQLDKGKRSPIRAVMGAPTKKERCIALLVALGVRVWM